MTLGPTPIDLGGIGKGWAVDAAAAVLGGAVTDFLVNAGGDLAVAGDGPGGDGWTVAVEDPRDPTLTLAVLRLERRQLRHVVDRSQALAAGRRGTSSPHRPADRPASSRWPPVGDRGRGHHRWRRDLEQGPAHRRT